jgi:putative Mg2+ transporter-C (MgtC) family protein
MMVSLGAAAFMLLALELYHEIRNTGATNSDPLRIVEGIATGIGFLGAGAILHRRGDIAGLTTAGSIWLAGAVGVASGGGHYVVAVSAVVFGLVVLRLVGIVESRVFPHVDDGPDD